MSPATAALAVLVWLALQPLIAIVLDCLQHPRKDRT